MSDDASRLEVTCPSCGKVYRVKPDLASHEIHYCDIIGEVRAGEEIRLLARNCGRQPQQGVIDHPLVMVAVKSPKLGR